MQKENSRVNDQSKDKRQFPTFDFVTALPLAACSERLERSAEVITKVPVGKLTPIQQRVTMTGSQSFVMERYYPGALQPIRLEGFIDPVEKGSGTWVHGGIARDVSNQIMLEGLLIFVIYFLMAVLLFLRLKTTGFAVSVPVLLILLVAFGARWRVLRLAVDDSVRWVRRKLYVTANQIK